MKGKSALLAGAAAFALIVTAQSAEAKKKHHAPPPPDATTDSTTSAEPAAPHPASNAELEARIKALEDEVEANKAKAESTGTRLSTLEQSFGDVQWSFDNARPTVKSGDGRFSMAIRVRFQGDFAGFANSANHPGTCLNPPTCTSVAAWNGKGHLSSGAVFRRAYFGVEGRAFRDFFYEFRFNAGGSDGGTNGVTEGDPLLNKAVLTYTGVTNAHVNVGVIEPNFMFEGTTSSAWLTFMERPEIDNIAADSYGGGDSRRGVEFNWQRQDTLWGGDNLNFTAAFTGGKTGSNAGHGNASGEQQQVLGRVSERLWSDGISNVQIGMSGADDLSTGGTGGSSLQLRDRPEIRVDGTRLIDTGAIASKHGYMWALDAGANLDSLFLGGEYAQFEVDRDPSGSQPKDHPRFSGWYVEASYFLTGETRSYEASALNNEVAGWDGPSAVASPFSLDGDSWGTWEVAARYSDTDLDWHKTVVSGGAGTPQSGIPGGRENVIDLAVNWYLNKNVRLMLDDLIVHLNKQSAAGVLGTSASVHPQSQDFNVVGVRLQFAN
jgi:phosphate-selective porin OprO and OprP